MAEPAFLRVSTVAEGWKCSPGKVRRMIEVGELPALRLSTMIRLPLVEGRSPDQRSVTLSRSTNAEANASLVLGAELQPGLYRLRVWSVCTASQGVTTAVKLLLKGPSELNLRPVTSSDLLHREG